MTGKRAFSEKARIARRNQQSMGRLIRLGLDTEYYVKTGEFRFKEKEK